MLSRDDIRKLERKAKALMLTKEMPQGKIEVVRSILGNTELLEEERYRAIIEILKNCPDRALPKVRFPEKIDTNVERSGIKKTGIEKKSLFRSQTVPPLPFSELYALYRSYGLFKKRYFAPSSNRFGITIRRRLIPAKKLLKLFTEIKRFQDVIMGRLPAILTMMLEDPALDDPVYFNFGRVLDRWLMQTPFADLTVEQCKWMDKPGFETEIKDWVKSYLSFRELDTAAKENLILAIETNLRMMSDLEKEPILPFDDQGVRSAKEKSNLERERTIYEYIITLRSFIPTVDQGEGSVCKFLNSRYTIISIEELGTLVLSALVWGRAVGRKEIIAEYNAQPVKVSSTAWDSSPETLKLYGKDPESKKRKHVASLKAILAEFEEEYDFINMRYDIADFVRKAFDEQWKIISKRRTDGSDVYDKDFFSYIDYCLAYFIAIYAPFLDGRTVLLVTPEGKRIESGIFVPNYFEGDLSSVTSLQDEIFNYKTLNPNFTLTRAEAKRVMAGQMSSMSDIEGIIRQLGTAFHSIAKNIHKSIISHREWRRSENAAEMIHFARSPLDRPDPLFWDIMQTRPIPFYDCRLAESDEYNAVQKMLVGRLIVSDSVKDGIISTIVAFCYQFAYECFNRSVQNDLEYRKDLIKKIEEASR